MLIRFRFEIEKKRERKEINDFLNYIINKSSRRNSQ